MDPQVGRARQDAFRERQDAFYVELFELAGVAIDADERELLAQFLGMAIVQGVVVGNRA